ncbi:hypothetical protein CBR_g617 [Chara braunii]|uniref:Reverse transcriptase domain-containing protein n=1 Tax=Chara braunii TaxID=69332 RepID=A0A388KBP0_CHABU|nr:hypothetical protein CBR_g617 [Chara braunii]|eukprot:GBG67482.1 hypothetical protein CBR_g617 [Chara braunii]
MDDILVFSKTHEYHVKHIEWVLHALKDAGFKVALEKSEFFLSENLFLGYIVTVDGLKPDPRKVAAVQDAPAPVTLTKVRAFLGMTSYYRHFIKGFAGIAKPLTNLLKKEEQLIWMPECEAAFQVLKEALTSAPVLARPDPTRPFALYTDWQPQAISAVLTQHDKDGREHVIEYASKTLSQAQANYEACKGECLAVVWGIQHFQPYLYGQKFVLVTDHQPLLSLRNNTNYTGTLGRWAVRLQDYDFDICHRATRQHGNADGLTRLLPPNKCPANERLIPWRPEVAAMKLHYGELHVRPEKEGTVALYPFAPLQTIDAGLLELIHLELLSIAQVIASEEEEIQPRLRMATAPQRTYNVVVIPDYIAQRAERLEDFPEERALCPPSSYPRPAPPKAPKKTPKRKRRHPSPGAQGSRIGGGEEVIQPARTCGWNDPECAISIADRSKGQLRKLFAEQFLFWHFNDMILQGQCPLLEELRFTTIWKIDEMPSSWFESGGLSRLRVLDVRELFSEQGDATERGLPSEYRSRRADSLVTAIARGCPLLAALSLNGLHTGITDEALKVIEEFLPRLERLGIGGSSITDAGLASIGTKLNSLRELTVQYCTRMTWSGVGMLQAQREDLVVIGGVGPLGYLHRYLYNRPSVCLM